MECEAKSITFSMVFPLPQCRIYYPADSSDRPVGQAGAYSRACDQCGCPIIVQAVTPSGHPRQRYHSACDLSTLTEECGRFQARHRTPEIPLFHFRAALAVPHHLTL